MIVNREEVLTQGKIYCDLSRSEGNAFALLGNARQWAKQLDMASSWETIYEEATSGDYENLLATLDKYFGDYVVFIR